MSPRQYFFAQQDERCPAHIKRLCKAWAEYRCEGWLYLAEKGEVLIPAMPMDEEPIPFLWTPYPNLWMPMGWGTAKRHTSIRHPEIRWIWTCQRSVYDCGEVDRYRPGHAGGHYDLVNVGELCHACNALKGKRWPWIDYRSDTFKRNRDQYIRATYGQQLWLWAL